MKTKKRGFGYFELVFDLSYLTAMLAVGLFYLSRAQVGSIRLAALMTLLLVLGDGFHLLPRVAVIVTGERLRFESALGFGKLVASITMTIFYILLWQLGLYMFPRVAEIVTPLVWLLALVRIALCLFPQNNWLRRAPMAQWGLIRNLPFILLGVIVCIAFGIWGAGIPNFRWMWLAILLSFAFYVPVILWVDRYPAVGMLMFPKTCAYIWMISMCFS